MEIMYLLWGVRRLRIAFINQPVYDLFIFLRRKQSTKIRETRRCFIRALNWSPRLVTEDPTLVFDWLLFARENSELTNDQSQIRETKRVPSDWYHGDFLDQKFRFEFPEIARSWPSS